MQIVENKLIAKVIEKKEKSVELDTAYAMRYKVFVEKLHWLPREDYPEQMETDEYDKHCIDFGVFTWSYQLIGYARLILEEGKFMLEREFSELVAGETLRKEPGVAEVSRLTILPHYRFYGRIRTSLLLYKILYQWALQHGIHFFYIVIDDKLYYNLKRQELISGRLHPVYQYQEGVSALVAYVDLPDRRAYLEKYNHRLFDYFTNSSPAASMKHLNRA